jgi:hypothetical protein
MGPISGLIGGLGSAGSIAQGALTVALTSESWTVLFAALAGLTAVAGGLMWRPIRIEIMQNRSSKTAQNSPLESVPSAVDEGRKNKKKKKKEIFCLSIV